MLFFYTDHETAYHMFELKIENRYAIRKLNFDGFRLGDMYYAPVNMKLLWGRGGWIDPGFLTQTNCARYAPPVSRSEFHSHYYSIESCQKPGISKCLSSESPWYGNVFHQNPQGMQMSYQNPQDMELYFIRISQGCISSTPAPPPLPHSSHQHGAL